MNTFGGGIASSLAAVRALSRMGADLSPRGRLLEDGTSPCLGGGMRTDGALITGSGERRRFLLRLSTGEGSGLGDLDFISRRDDDPVFWSLARVFAQLFLPRTWDKGMLSPPSSEDVGEGPRELRMTTAPLVRTRAARSGVLWPRAGARPLGAGPCGCLWRLRPSSPRTMMDEKA